MIKRGKLLYKAFINKNFSFTCAIAKLYQQKSLGLSTPEIQLGTLD